MGFNIVVFSQAIALSSAAAVGGRRRRMVRSYSDRKKRLVMALFRFVFLLFRLGLFENSLQVLLDSYHDSYCTPYCVRSISFQCQQPCLLNWSMPLPTLDLLGFLESFFQETGENFRRTICSCFILISNGKDKPPALAGRLERKVRPNDRKGKLQLAEFLVSFE